MITPNLMPIIKKKNNTIIFYILLNYMEWNTMEINIYVKKTSLFTNNLFGFIVG